MIRNSISLVALAVVICGCNGGVAPTNISNNDRDQPGSRTAAVVTDPELETVPEQSEPEDADSRSTTVFAELVKAADSNDAEGWAKAEKELHELGASAVTALKTGLADENHVTRELAAMFLAQLGPDAEPAADALVKLLEDESSFARVNAAAALSTLDAYAIRTMPVLKGLLADDDASVRVTAAVSLRNVGPSAASAVDRLTQALNDPESQVRVAAATTLGELGPAAKTSLPALRQLEADDNRELAAEASRAIRRIDESARDNTAVAIPASATE